MIPYISLHTFPYLSLTSLFSWRKTTPLLLRLFVETDDHLPWTLSSSNPGVYLLLELSTSLWSLQLKFSSFTIWFSKCQQNHQTPKKRWGHIPQQPSSVVRKREALQSSVGFEREQIRQMYFGLWNILQLFSSLFFALEGYVIFSFPRDVNDLRSSVLFNL